MVAVLRVTPQKAIPQNNHPNISTKYHTTIGHTTILLISHNTLLCDLEWFTETFKWHLDKGE